MSDKGRFLSNIFDPHNPQAQMYFTYSLHAMDSGQVACDVEWKHHMEWIDKNIIALPKATEAYTQKQLIKMSLVGIYAQQGE